MALHLYVVHLASYEHIKPNTSSSVSRHDLVSCCLNVAMPIQWVSERLT